MDIINYTISNRIKEIRKAVNQNNANTYPSVSTYE